MKGYTPGLFDRLLGVPNRGPGKSTSPCLSIEELKDTVARDLESLLNTRTSIADGELKAYPQCSRSLVSYGLGDFADLCISSPVDRASICASIEKTIACHEPRLRKVRVRLGLQGESMNRLSLSITAVLVASVFQEAVSFDAVLTPSTQQYSISKAGKAARLASPGT